MKYLVIQTFRLVTGLDLFSLRWWQFKDHYKRETENLWGDWYQTCFKMLLAQELTPLTSIRVVPDSKYRRNIDCPDCSRLHFSASRAARQENMELFSDLGTERDHGTFTWTWKSGATWFVSGIHNIMVQHTISTTFAEMVNVLPSRLWEWWRIDWRGMSESFPHVSTFCAHFLSYLSEDLLFRICFPCIHITYMYLAYTPIISYRTSECVRHLAWMGGQEI
jgi:hypothetical protein